MDAKNRRALVTGASSGLGAEFARELARRGINLVISARRRDRLESLAAELNRDHNIDVLVLPADLASPEGPRQLFAAVQNAGLQIGILINNAGFGYFGLTLDQSLAQIDEMLAVNVGALTTLTRLFAESMKAQGGGYILQVSSYAALAPIPRYAVYSGAKAHVIAFTQALRYELRKSGVSLSVVAPGFMNTEFHDVAHHEKTWLMRRTTISASMVARKAIAGMFKRKLLMTPGAVYRINNWMLRFLPRSAASAITAAMVKS
jgi:short-subunit dehydrogenase